MILQARKKWLARFQQHDGVVVEMVEVSRGQGFAKPCTREREEGGEVVKLGYWGVSLPCAAHPLYRLRGWGGAPQSLLGPVAKGGKLAPQDAPLGLGFAPTLSRMGLGELDAA